MADRFFCPDPPVDGLLTLCDEEARHLVKVRRLGIGDGVEVFDGRGNATAARVVEVGRDRVALQSVGAPLSDRLAVCPITLATAVPKGERFDWLVEQATEIGVRRLVPLLTERSVVDPRSGKLDRQRRRVIEASKQCGRNTLMDIDEPTPWPDFLSMAEPTLRALAHPAGATTSNWAVPKPGTSIALAIGPEGGFTESEVRSATDAGWHAINLGPTILRIETAGLVACAAILALCERASL